MQFLIQVIAMKIYYEEHEDNEEKKLQVLHVLHGKKITNKFYVVVVML